MKRACVCVCVCVCVCALCYFKSPFRRVQNVRRLMSYTPTNVSIVPSQTARNGVGCSFLHLLLTHFAGCLLAILYEIPEKKFLVFGLFTVHYSECSAGFSSGTYLCYSFCPNC